MIPLENRNECGVMSPLLGAGSRSVSGTHCVDPAVHRALGIADCRGAQMAVTRAS